MKRNITRDRLDAAEPALTRDGWWLVGEPDSPVRFGERVYRGWVVNGRNKGKRWRRLCNEYRTAGTRLEHHLDYEVPF